MSKSKNRSICAWKNIYFIAQDLDNSGDDYFWVNKALTKDKHLCDEISSKINNLVNIAKIYKIQNKYFYFKYYYKNSFFLLNLSWDIRDSAMRNAPVLIFIEDPKYNKYDQLSVELIKNFKSFIKKTDRDWLTDEQEKDLKNEIAEIFKKIKKKSNFNDSFNNLITFNISNDK